MLFKHPILSHDAEALEKVQKLTLKFVKELFYFTHRRIRGDIITSMFKITHGLWELSTGPVFTHSTCTGLRGHAYGFHQQRCYTYRRQFAFSIQDAPFWNKLPSEIVSASSVASFKTSLDGCHCSLKYPYNPFPSKIHSLCTRNPTYKLTPT